MKHQAIEANQNNNQPYDPAYDLAVATSPGQGRDYAPTYWIGTELNRNFSYAKVAEACGFKGVVADTTEKLTEAIRVACEEQAKGVTTFIEVVLNQELGEPFRRDAMKKPVPVAGIDKADMKKQDGF